jgi:hypothetical protein
MPAKKRLGLDDAQRIPPRRRQRSERDQHGIRISAVGQIVARPNASAFVAEYRPAR